MAAVTVNKTIFTGHALCGEVLSEALLLHCLPTEMAQIICIAQFSIPIESFCICWLNNGSLYGTMGFCIETSTRSTLKDVEHQKYKTLN